VGIALLVWMYMVSLVILIGAEFNAMIFPRMLMRGPVAEEVRDSKIAVR